MMLIGLTGSMASGKSTVAAMLKKSGVPVIDADDLSRQACAPGTSCLNQIVQELGQEVLNADGSLNRGYVGKIVFNDPKKLQQLEAIVHPAIHDLFLKELKHYEAQKQPIVVYVAPLLFEKNLQDKFDLTLLVTAPDEVVLTRAHARDQLSLADIQKRLQQQMNNQEKARLADVVIDNSGSKEDLFIRLNEAWKKVCNKKLVK